MLLHKFFPSMARLETQFKKYGKEIAMLERENATLEKKLEASKQQQEMQFIRQFYASIPEEYNKAYRAAQQKRPQTQQ